MAETIFNKPLDGTVASLNTAITNVNSKIATYQFGSVASLSAFVTALNTYVSGMGQYDFKNIVVDFSAVSAPFTAARYIGTVSRTTSARAQVMLQLHNGQQVIHGIQNESTWDWKELATIPTLYEDSKSSYSLSSGQEPTVLSTTLSAGTYLVSVHLTWGTTSCGRYIRVDGDTSNEIRVQDSNWSGHESTVSGIVKTTGALSLRLFQNSGSSMTVNVVSFRAVRLI